MSEVLSSVEDCVDRLLDRVGPELVVGAPLGLGKPVQLLNAIFERVASDPALSLHIYTALSLELPQPDSPIEAALSGPIMERLFGDYEELAYAQAMRADTMPSNIRVSELYFKAGSMKNNRTAQQHYISSNYTHICRDMLDAGVNVMVQLVAARDTAGGLAFSLGCNPDISLEMFDSVQALDRPVVFAAQVHGDMPFMEHDASVSPEHFDLIVRNAEYDKTLFAVPNAAVPLQDYATALHASSLVRDGGTLQIGIGALGDAVAHACIIRHRQNAQYRNLLSSLTQQQVPLADDLAPFKAGLYVSTEMFVNGMMQLIEQGVVKRRVYDELRLQEGLNRGEITESVDEALYAFVLGTGLMPAVLDPTSLERLAYWGIVPDSLRVAGQLLTLGSHELVNDLNDPGTRRTLLEEMQGKRLRNGRILHGGFFLGPRDFYEKLRNLNGELQESICMTGVRRTNQLLLDYPLYCAQRRHARFINTGMIASISGAVASDALEDGTVISGVGGQYNFVAMAHDLPGARSVLCIRSTRGSGKQLKSNIVPFYGHTTIPKHLRDVIVTEYGIADLRGQSDAEVIKRMISVADSRFQSQLLEFAKNHGKIERDYSIPFEARNNTPRRLRGVLKPHIDSGLLPPYPFGTEMTEEEIALGASLRHIKSLSDEPSQFIASTFKALLHRGDEEAARPFLERVQLDHPETTREFIIQQLLMMELQERGLLKVS